MNSVELITFKKSLDDSVLYIQSFKDIYSDGVSEFTRQNAGEIASGLQNSK